MRGYPEDNWTSPFNAFFHFDGQAEKSPFCCGSQGEGKARKIPVLLPRWPCAETVFSGPGSVYCVGPDFTSRWQRVEASQLFQDNQNNFKGGGGP
jgi:hypothetical protein